MRRRRPLSLIIADDLRGYELGYTNPLQVFEVDEPIDTGLLDEFGEPIRRQQVRQPMGFVVRK